MPVGCDKVCETCGNYHKSENFDCEHWGDLDGNTTTCHVWTEGDLPHNLQYRIRKLEDMVLELQKKAVIRAHIIGASAKPLPVIDADQGQRDQLTTRLSLRRDK